MAEDFTEMMFGGGAQPAAPMIPPRPKDSSFASFFGLGPQRDAAYAKGIEAGGQHRLRTAQTESALAEADKRRGEAMRESQANALRDKIVNNPSYMPTASEMMLIATGANDFSNARLGYQEHDQRASIADMLTPQEDRLAAMEAVSGRPVERFYDSGAGMQASQLFPSAAPTVTPVGQAQIDNYRERPASAGAGTAGSPLIRSSPLGPVQSTDGGKTWNPVLQNTDVAAAAAAKAAGTATGQKQAALYANLNNLDTFKLTVDQLMTAPGFNTIYGASSILDPRNYIRGTDAQDAEKLREQLQSRSFLASIQAMRGMGALSNAEGMKVETALTSALAPGLDEATAAQRLNQLKGAIDNLRAVAIQEANATENALVPPTAAGAAPAGRAFASEAEVEAAAASEGWSGPTKITIGGRPATWSP